MNCCTVGFGFVHDIKVDGEGRRGVSLRGVTYKRLGLRSIVECPLLDMRSVPTCFPLSIYHETVITGGFSLHLHLLSPLNSLLSRFNPLLPSFASILLVSRSLNVKITGEYPLCRKLSRKCRPIAEILFAYYEKNQFSLLFTNN